jgi:hypothetical protein
MLGQEEMIPEWTLRKREEKNMGSGGSGSQVLFSLLQRRESFQRGIASKLQRDVILVRSGL